MDDSADSRTSLYRALSTRAVARPGLRYGETIVTEQVETVDGDRSIEWLLDASLIA